MRVKGVSLEVSFMAPIVFAMSSKGADMWRVRGRRSVLSLILTLSVVGVSARAEMSRAVANAARTSTTAALPVGTVPLFVHYYLWWDAHHWRSKLGSSYPMSASTLPLPASLSS